MGDEIELTEDDLEALRPILEHARRECGAASRAAVEEVDAALGAVGPGTYAVADISELRDLLESIRDDRCPVDRDALESLLAKF